MKKISTLKYRSLVVCILIALFLNNAFAAPPDIGNLKTYNFDTQQQQQSYTSVKSIITFVVYILLFIIISLLAFFTTRWIARFQTNTRPKSKYMEVIDILPIGSNKGIYIIKTPQGIILLGVSEKDIFMISRLNDEEAALIDEVEKANSGTFNKAFANHLEYFLKNLIREPGKRDNGDDS
ncbi:MAG: flagellar biosynthetic protein FliO [Tepidanaerobacteraceae bacterium]|jgi:flagellar protein FliO/FliZ|nr:flagellar biosynthetic protein FliO [Tepidanaerobacteraceae bacterium]